MKVVESVHQPVPALEFFHPMSGTPACEHHLTSVTFIQSLLCGSREHQQWWNAIAPHRLQTAVVLQLSDTLVALPEICEEQGKFSSILFGEGDAASEHYIDSNSGETGKI